VDPGVVRRLLVALGASAALHLSLLYTVRLAAPAPHPAAAVLRARLQAGARPPARDEREASQLPFRAPSTSPGVRKAVQTAEAPQTATAAAAAHRAGPEPQPAAPELLSAVQAPFVRDTTWYPARLLDVFPRPVETPHPVYPEQAGLEGVRGEVTLVMLIDESGAVHEVSVAAAQPEGYFEAAAIAAFHGVQFEPARKDGQAVRSRVLVKVAFSPDE
jgi:protein TonB